MIGGQPREKARPHGTEISDLGIECYAGTELEKKFNFTIGITAAYPMGLLLEVSTSRCNKRKGIIYDRASCKTLNRESGRGNLQPERAYISVPVLFPK